MKRRAEVDAIVGGFIKQRTLADAIRFFEEAEVTAAPVYDIGQFLDDPHVQQRGIVVEAPDDEMGEVPMHAVVPRLERHARAAAQPGAGDRPAQPRDLRPHRLLRASASPRSRRKASSDDGRAPRARRSSLILPVNVSRASWRRRTRAAPTPSSSTSRTRCRPRRRPARASSSVDSLAARRPRRRRGAGAGEQRPRAARRRHRRRRPPRPRRPVDPQGGIGRAGPRHRRRRSSALERTRGLPPGHLRLSLAIETPRGLLARRGDRARRATASPP